MMIEKPSGRDLASARAINDDLHQLLEEDQILRIDHFLGKQPVLDIQFRVSDSGEGRWPSIASIEEGIPAPVLTTAPYSRFAPRGLDDFAVKTPQPCAWASADTKKRRLEVTEVAEATDPTKPIVVLQTKFGFTPDKVGDAARHQIAQHQPEAPRHSETQRRHP